MRKQSHIALAKYLVVSLDEPKLRKFKMAFYFGNILPDLKPSFLYRKHQFCNTFSMVKVRMQFLSGRKKQKYHMQKIRYFIQLGEIAHYLADYFTFPHNPGYDGNIKEHIKYEKELGIYLESAIEEASNEQRQSKEVEGNTFFDLIFYIEAKREAYFKEESGIKNDAAYALEVNKRTIERIIKLYQMEQMKWSYQMLEELSI